MNDNKLMVDFDLARSCVLGSIASEDINVSAAHKDTLTITDALTITDVGKTGLGLCLDTNYSVFDSTAIDRHESYNTTIGKCETYKNNEDNENQLQEQRNPLRGERRKEQGGLLCRIRKPRIAILHLKYKEINPRY